jgi:hypothetical protein
MRFFRRFKYTQTDYSAYGAEIAPMKVNHRIKEILQVLGSTIPDQE